MKFFLFFFIMGLLELSLFARISMMIGPGMVVLLCILSALIGFDLLTRQGMAVVRSAFRFGEGDALGLGDVFDGICKAVAGMLFIMPGFLSDILALLLLLPVMRHHLRGRLAQRYPQAANTNTRSADVLEGDYERVDESDSDNRLS